MALDAYVGHSALVYIMRGSAPLMHSEACHSGLAGLHLSSHSYRIPFRGYEILACVVISQDHRHVKQLTLLKSISGCCFLNFSSISIFFISSLVGCPIA